MLKSSMLSPINAGSTPAPRTPIAPTRAVITAHRHTARTTAPADPDPEAITLTFCSGAVSGRVCVKAVGGGVFYMALPIKLALPVLS